MSNFAIRFVVALTDVLTGEQIVQLFEAARDSGGHCSPSLRWTDTPKPSGVQEEILRRLFDADALRLLADDEVKKELATANEELRKTRELLQKTGRKSTLR